MDKRGIGLIRPREQRMTSSSTKVTDISGKEQAMKLKHTAYLVSGVSAITLLAAASGPAAAADSAEGTASANVVEAITITNENGLDFGDFAPDPDNAKEVVIDPAGGPRTGSATLLSSNDGSPAEFTVTGDENQTYKLAGSDSQVTLDPDNVAAPSMVADLDYLSANEGAVDPSSTLIDLTLGGDTLTVGGSLNVGADQPADTYSGAFSVSVDYD